MFDFPDSSAMDATASSGGPGTFLREIATGQPARIAQHSCDLLAKATQFVAMLDEFTRAAEQLRTAWSGAASQLAAEQITGSLRAFEDIITVVQTGARVLGASGVLVQSAQTAYRAVVGSVNPTVASLMSSPWTYGAAVALSTATSASLRTYITTIEERLRELGIGQLGPQIAVLAAIATHIEQLASHGDASCAALATRGSSSTSDGTETVAGGDTVAVDGHGVSTVSVPQGRMADVRTR